MSLKHEIGGVVGWVRGLRSPLVPWTTLLAGFIFICASGDGAHVRFAFLGSGVSAVDSSNVVIIFADADRSRMFEGRDFRVTPAFQTPHSPTFGASASGPLTVDVRLDRGSESLATGRVTVPLQDGWRYDVEVAVGRENLPIGCSDCAAVRAFPLADVVGAAAAEDETGAAGSAGSEGVDGTGGDSLYVIWRGSPASGLVAR